MWNGQNWGYHEKDKLESFLAIQVKAGNITPKDAQSCILKDWVACSMKYIEGGLLGSAMVSDPDD